MSVTSRRLAAAASSFLLLMLSLPAHASLPTVPVPAASAAAAPVAGVGASGLAQAGLGMALVLGLIFLCAWLARRFGLQRLGGGQLVKAISSTSVGQRERVVVVEVAGSWLVLGVTAQQVNLLHTMAPQSLPAAAASTPAAPPPFAQAFSQLLRQSLTGGKARTANP